MAIKGIRQVPPGAELSLVRAAGGLVSSGGRLDVGGLGGSWSFMGCEKVRIGMEEGSFSPSPPHPPQSGSGGYQPVGL